MSAREADIIYPEGTNIAISNGNVMPMNPKQVSPSSILNALKKAITQPYEGDIVELQGKSCLEAAAMMASTKAAEGDLVAFEKILNRIMGKPVQQVASLQMTTTLQDVLNNIIKEEGGQTEDNDSVNDQEEVDPFGD